MGVHALQGAREETSAVDMEKAKREAQELYQAGEKKWGTDESKFNVILATRSFPQLRATFDEYIKVGSGHSSTCSKLRGTELVREP